MSYAEHWRDHCLPRVERVARLNAIRVYHGMIGVEDVPTATYSEALDSTLRTALDTGAHRLPPPIWRDLETHLAEVISSVIEALERSWPRRGA